ncbi:MAG: S8 family serine peptidase [Candidatus Eisenbacteria bacterium]|uniref:S8 family serine peptidase n=1 Tax=Eiseniibacteriota bacterium TaxID=2212470 RepID=A0A933WAR4_UNCEI|nr:S8 family serine peptidase [Candidatus Eisenbacteria bacterium]
MRRSRGLFALLSSLALPALVSAAFAAAPAYEPGEVLVRFRAEMGAARRAALREDLGATLVERFDVPGLERLRVAGRVEDAVAALRARADVAYAEPNWLWSADARPNDPSYPQLWGLRNAGQTGGTPGADIHAEAAWDAFTGDPEMLVGVIDSGVEVGHPDLLANLWTNPGEVVGNQIDDDGNGYVDDVHGYDFANRDGDPSDDNGHGTHVAGTIAATGNNRIGVVGVNWRAKIVALKFLRASGSGNTADAIAAIQYAVRMHVRVLNNSWGGGPYSQALHDAIAAAGEAGIVFVAAAGNSGLDNDVVPQYPASIDLPNVIAVAATDRDDQLAAFSNWGASSVDIAAPGVDIYSTWPGRTYQYLSGTSMAAPFVSGACALLLGRFPDMGPAQLRARLLSTADRLPWLAGRVASGARLNLFLASADPDTIPPGAVTDLAPEEPGSTSYDFTWTATGDDGPAGRATSYELRWSTSPIDSNTFAEATPSAVGAPEPSGAPEHVRVFGLPLGADVYVALRARDEFGNAGPLSNAVRVTTLPAPRAGVAPLAFEADLRTGESVEEALVLRNDSPGTLEWSVPTPALEVSASATVVWPDEEPAKGRDGAPRGPQADAAGGPDPFGYRWLDSSDPRGPAFAWVDVASPERAVALTGDDELSGEVPIGFSFPFYGRRHTSVRVSTNGYLTFGNDPVPFTNSGLPSTRGVHTMIAPCWDDLNFGASTKRAYAALVDGRFVVTWLDVPRYADPASAQTFQTVLYPSGEIRFQYLAGTGVRNNCTVGVQDTTRTIGLTVSFNQDYVRDSLAVRIMPLRQWLTVTPPSGFLAPGATATAHVRLDASALPTATYTGAVHVRTNDPLAPDVALPVTMRVEGAPDVRFGPDTLDFGHVFVGAADTLMLNVGNDGVDALHLLWRRVEAPFAIAFEPRTLLPGETAAFPVVFAPRASGVFEQTLDVGCDDPDMGLLHVVLRGSAAPPPVAVYGADSLRLVTANGIGDAVRDRTVPLRLRNEGGSPLHWRALVETSGPVSGTRAPAAEGVPHTSGAGGPDAAGYRWTDSDAPGGPAFQWQEIATTGTRLFGSADDSTRTDVALPFDFPFYGGVYRSVNVCTNGWLSFLDRRSSFRDVSLPDTAAAVPRALIAPWWDDLDLRTTTGGGRAYAHYDGSRFILEWRDAVHYAVGGPYTFQVLLSPSGAIDFQYLSVASPADRATIGIQDETGTRGLTLAHDAPYAHSGLRVRIQRLPEWLSVVPDSGVIAPGAEDTLQVGMSARGYADGEYGGALEFVSDDIAAPSRLVGARMVVSRTNVALAASPGTVGSLAHASQVRVHGPAGAGLTELAPGHTTLGGVRPSGAPVVDEPGRVTLEFDALDYVLGRLPEGEHRLPFVALAGDRTWLSDSVLVRVSRPELEVAGMPGWDDGLPRLEALSGKPLALAFQPPALADRYEVALSLDGGRAWITLASTPAPAWVLTPLVVSDGSLVEVSAWSADSLTGVWLSAPFRVNPPPSTGVEPAVPGEFALRLLGARPGQLPVRLQFDVPAGADGALEVFDLRGARVRTLARGALVAGRHAFDWDGRGNSGEAAASGVYFVRARLGGAAIVRRVVLTR